MNTALTQGVAPPKGRLAVGTTIFVVGFASPLLVPVVASSNLSPAWKTTLSGLLLVGIPELFTIAAVAVLGKDGFTYLTGGIKKRLGAFMAKHGPTEVVSARRYKIGLVLFLIPVLLGWVVPYTQHHIPGYESNEFLFAVGGDVLLISSLFVLGGEFWDKLRALFVYRATAVFPK